MPENDSIKVYGEQKIRTAWDAEREEWFFSVQDVVAALTDSVDPKQYIKKMRARDPELSGNWGTICTPVQMIAADGKKRKVQAAEKPETFKQSIQVAKQGGEVAGIARKELEKRTGKPVISSKNAEQLSAVVVDMIEGVSEMEKEKEK